MGTRPFVIFELRGALYALPSAAVVRIFSLPELVSIAEMPPYVAGLLNVAGEIVPVIDLGLRLGFGPWQPSLQDTVILFRLDGATFGVIVGDVVDVRPIPSQESPPYSPMEGVRFVTRVAAVGDDLIAVIDPEILLRHSEAIADLAELSVDLDRPAGPFAPDADEGTRKIFRERALSLARRHDVDAAAPAAGLLLFSLAGERYAIDLEIVQEVAEIRDMVPIPCAPEKIVGLMNLRGEIVTLVSIAAAIGASAAITPVRVIIAKCGALRAGLVADEVHDIVQVAAIASASGAAGEPSYVRGTVSHDDRVYALLDVAGMFEARVFEVYEEVAG